MNFFLFRTTTVFFLLSVTLSAMDYVEFRQRGEIRKETGRIVIPAEDGLAFEARDGKYFVIPTADVISQRSDDQAFMLFSKKEIIERLKLEFPADQGFELLVTDHFLTVYTTSEGFARWYSSLLESLYSGYVAFWQQRGVTLQKPELPMVAVLLSNRNDLVRYAQTEGFTLFDKQIAYYNQFTNRVALCDLSGLQTHREGERGRASSKERQAFLNHPDAAKNVATVVHEATHLVGFSCGMHPRFAPNPYWLLEGLAVFHEVPDLKKREGWSIAPKVSPYRMRQLGHYLRTNPHEPLQRIIEKDAPFKQALTAEESYAMTWGLTYFLVKRRPKEFTAYLQLLQTKTPLSPDSPEIRLKDFEQCFGTDWNRLYKECGDYLLKLKY